MPDHRAVPPREAVQQLVDFLHPQAVGQLLGFVPVSDFNEGVVDDSKRDAVPAELGGKPMVAIEIDLESEGTPGGHPDIAQPQLFIDEVEVVVQAPPLTGLQVGRAGLFVVPGLVGCAAFHGRKDGHHPRTIAALADDLPHQLVFAQLVIPYELDLQAVVGGQALGGGAQFVAERFGKVGVVEDSDAAGTEVQRHPSRISNRGERALDHDPVVATQDSSDLVSVTIG